jgi:hypothetical protein
MSPSDPDKVADRITALESAVSGKQDTLTTTSGTITASTNVTIIRPNAIKWGNIKCLSCAFKVDGTTTTIGTIPSSFAPTNTIDFSVVGDNGSSYRLQIVAGNTTISIADLGTQGEYHAFTICYI